MLPGRSGSRVAQRPAAGRLALDADRPGSYPIERHGRPGGDHAPRPATVSLAPARWRWRCLLTLPLTLSLLLPCCCSAAAPVAGSRRRRWGELTRAAPLAPLPSPSPLPPRGVRPCRYPAQPLLQQRPVEIATASFDPLARSRSSAGPGPGLFGTIGYGNRVRVRGEGKARGRPSRYTPRWHGRGTVIWRRFMEAAPDLRRALLATAVLRRGVGHLPVHPQQLPVRRARPRRRGPRLARAAAGAARLPHHLRRRRAADPCCARASMAAVAMLLTGRRRVGPRLPGADGRGPGGLLAVIWSLGDHIIFAVEGPIGLRAGARRQRGPAAGPARRRPQPGHHPRRSARSSASPGWWATATTCSTGWPRPARPSPASSTCACSSAADRRALAAPGLQARGTASSTPSAPCSASASRSSWPSAPGCWSQLHGVSVEHHRAALLHRLGPGRGACGPCSARSSTGSANAPCWPSTSCCCSASAWSTPSPATCCRRPSTCWLLYAAYVARHGAVRPAGGAHHLPQQDRRGPGRHHADHRARASPSTTRWRCRCPCSPATSGRRTASAGCSCSPAPSRWPASSSACGSACRDPPGRSEPVAT